MKKEMKKNLPHTGLPKAHFFIIIFTALVVQMLNRYHALHWTSGSYHHYGYIITCILIPLIVILSLRIPFAKLGLGLPQLDKKTMSALALIGFILIIAFSMGQFFQIFVFDEYSGKFTTKTGDTFSRLYNFIVFTGFALPSWEFLHRSFLLFGTIYVLARQDMIPAPVVHKYAIALVWVFEVVFHFVKPEYEALGMLIGSPVLSYLAIRTKSIWPAVIVHLSVEILFIFTIILRG